MEIKKLDDILDRLDRENESKYNAKKMRAEAELKTLDREQEAFYNGAYAAIKAVKAALERESKEADGHEG